MTPQELDDMYRPLAALLQEGHMHRLGIETTMQLASRYNQCKFFQEKAWRDELFRNQFDQLLEANGRLTREPLEFHDGWALDRSGSLPHLEPMMEEADRMLAERQGIRLSEFGAYRSYFQNVFTPEDAWHCPAIVDFATSSDMIATVGQYLGTIPALSNTLPAGIRVVESNDEFDDEPNRPKDSQLFHIDYYSKPNVYVLVLLRDTTLAHGPWTFLPASTSRRIREELGYWKAGRDYRLSDQEVYSLVDPQEAIPFTYPRGTVLFIESSGCMHFGSRNSIRPRLQVMLGYTGVCRTDFTEVVIPNQSFPQGDSDSLLRKLVLDKKHLAPDQKDIVNPDILPIVHRELGQAAHQVGVDLKLTETS